MFSESILEERKAIGHRAELTSDGQWIRGNIHETRLLISNSLTTGVLTKNQSLFVADYAINYSNIVMVIVFVTDTVNSACQGWNTLGDAQKNTD